MPDDITSASLGFLTIVEHEPHGLFGGYLLLNAAGRPLEFHCTAPIKPNRAQQILYGPTLEPYLYGEQIGATLVKASQQSPRAVLVDQRAALVVREHIDFPTALVVAPGAQSHARLPDASLHLAHDNSSLHPQSDLQEFVIEPNRLLVPERYPADREQIVQRLASCDEWFDFREPFQRIRTAIEEAQRASSKAA
jgi:hypothetical protein